MTPAVRVHKYGGPEVLIFEEVDIGRPGPGEVRLRQHAIGVNFVDVYQRSGLYKLPSFPAILGSEGAGEVVEVGEGVETLTVGDRVAYATAPGAYAEERLAPADKLVKLPPDISYETAAAMMLRGMTARYLLRDTYKVNSETIMLFHAAAGGVGHIACQWGRALGATIIGTVGSDAKAEVAKANGCTHTIVMRREDFVTRVNELTGGRGCDVVYDFDRQGHVSEISRLPEAERTVGFVRQLVRSGAAFRIDGSERLAFRHAPVSFRLYREKGGSRTRGRTFRDGVERQNKNRNQSPLSAS